MKVCGITCYPPKWVENIRNEKRFAPLPYMLKLETEEEYIKEYQEKILDKLNYKEVIDFLKNISEDKDIVVLCFEKPGQFCHRHLFGKWITSFGEYQVKEFELEDKNLSNEESNKIKEEFIQGELF